MFLKTELSSESRLFSSELQQSRTPSPSSPVLLACPPVVRRGTGGPVGSLAGRAGRGGGPRSGPEQSPEPSARLRRTDSGRDAPPTSSPPAGRSRPEVWASPAGETRGHEAGLHAESHDRPSVSVWCLILVFVFCVSTILNVSTTNFPHKTAPSWYPAPPFNSNVHFYYVCIFCLIIYVFMYILILSCILSIFPSGLIKFYLTWSINIEELSVLRICQSFHHQSKLF